MDVAKVNQVEGDLDAFISKRDKQRRRAEGHRPSEALWVESCRRYAQTRCEEELWERLLFATAMRRSHTRTFAELDAKYSRMISDLETQLGLRREGAA